MAAEIEWIWCCALVGGVRFSDFFFGYFLPGAIAGPSKLAGRGMRSRVVEGLVVKKVGKETRGDQVGEGVDVWGQGTVLSDFGGFGADGLLGLSG